MNKILLKVNEIIKNAENDQSFFETNAANLIATGERSVDYSLYCIEIDSDNFLIVDFVDYSLESFSVVHKNHKSEIDRMILDYLK